jgi:hypothetical protein
MDGTLKIRHRMTRKLPPSCDQPVSAKAARKHRKTSVRVHKAQGSCTESSWISYQTCTTSAAKPGLPSSRPQRAVSYSLSRTIARSPDVHGGRARRLRYRLGVLRIGKNRRRHGLPSGARLLAPIESLHRHSVSRGRNRATFFPVRSGVCDRRTSIDKKRKDLPHIRFATLFGQQRVT